MKAISLIILIMLGVGFLSGCTEYKATSPPDIPNDPIPENNKWVEIYLFKLGNNGPLTRDELITISSSQWKIEYIKSIGSTIEVVVLQKQNYSYYEQWNTWWDTVDVSEFYFSSGGKDYSSDTGFPPGDYRLLLDMEEGEAHITIDEWMK